VRGLFVIEKNLSFSGIEEGEPHAKIAKGAKNAKKNHLLAFFAPFAIFA